MADNVGGCYMEPNPVQQVSNEIDARVGATDVGMLTLRTANKTLQVASQRPDPEDLYNGLWYEGEVCCLFADSNVGKSIYAVQMADEIARLRNVLYVDCELSDKQFQLRYTDRESGMLHEFPESLIRAEINPSKMDMKNFEEQIITDIETAAQKAATDTIIIDNLTYLCNSSEKGDQAGIFMMKLMNLKMKYNWSLLVIAHTPKRNMTNPITQNDLAGSKKLYNFFDSVFAIGKSAADPKLRYVKQVKVRAGEYRYDADNVIVYEIEHETDNVRFAFKGFAKESEHLKEQTEEERISLNQQAHELRKEGKSIREIAAQLGMSKSTVDRMLKSVPPVPPKKDGTSGTNGTKDKSNVKPKEDETLF